MANLLSHEIALRLAFSIAIGGSSSFANPPGPCPEEVLLSALELSCALCSLHSSLFYGRLYTWKLAANVFT